MSVELADLDASADGYETIELSGIGGVHHEQLADAETELHDGSPTLLSGAVRRSPSFTERIISAASRSTNAISSAAAARSGESSYAAPIYSSDTQADPDALGWVTVALSTLLCLGGMVRFYCNHMIYIISDYFNYI